MRLHTPGKAATQGAWTNDMLKAEASPCAPPLQAHRPSQGVVVLRWQGRAAKLPAEAALQRSHRRWALGGALDTETVAVGCTAGAATGRRRRERCCCEWVPTWYQLGGKRAQESFAGASWDLWDAQA